MFIGIIQLSTLENTKYVKIETDSESSALLILKNYANIYYKDQIVSIQVLDTIKLEKI